MAEVRQGAFTPQLFYRDPFAALGWLEAAFGFETSLVVTGPDGSVGHAAMTFEGSEIHIGGELIAPELIGPATMRSPASLEGAGTQFVRVSLDSGLDAHCERARAAGARITQTPVNQFYGSRTYRVLDLEGHVWTFEQPVAEVSLEDMAKASGLSIRTHL